MAFHICKIEAALEYTIVGLKPPNPHRFWKAATPLKIEPGLGYLSFQQMSLFPPLFCRAQKHPKIRKEEDPTLTRSLPTFAVRSLAPWIISPSAIAL